MRSLEVGSVPPALERGGKGFHLALTAHSRHSLLKESTTLSTAVRSSLGTASYGGGGGGLESLPKCGETV